MRVASAPAAWRVGVVQLTSTRDVDANLERACHWLRVAAGEGAQLIVLPENYAFLGDQELPNHAQTLDGPFTAPLRALARELSVFVVAGSIPERGPSPERVYSTSVVIGRQGETLQTYRKIHLFDVAMGEAQFAESKQIAPGEAPACVDLDAWRLGLSICYDLRFPELYRILSRRGAHLLSVPAAFTLHTGKDHWEPLLRARAIENQCYVVAAGQFGRHDARRISWGKSMVVDPWGSVLAQVPEAEGVAVASLNYDLLNQIRQGLPALAHRRLADS